MASASRNWRSSSQPKSRTTPCCRNGTIASPEPNVNAPALKKNVPSCSRRSGSTVRVAARRPPRPSGSSAGLGAAPRSHPRGVYSRTPPPNFPEPHRELRRHGAGKGLRDREALEVLILRVPATVLDEIALHVARERDGSTEAERAKTQEVAGDLADCGRVARRSAHGAARDGTTTSSKDGGYPWESGSKPFSG